MSTRSLDPKLADFPVTSVEKPRYADTDLQGHITTSVFAVCCQNARMELICDPKRVPIPPNTQFVITRLVLEFRAEMHWPGTVEIGTRVETAEALRAIARPNCGWVPDAVTSSVLLR
jgi:acyl-CoA thioester hydrolase